MLAAKRDQVVDRRFVATLGVCSQELTALRETKRIYTWRVAYYGIRCQRLANLVDLGSNVAKKCGISVLGPSRAESNEVDVRAWVCCFCKSRDTFHPVICIAVSQAMPYHKR